MNPKTLTAPVLCMILHLKVKAHKSDVSKVSLCGPMLMVYAFLAASGLMPKVKPTDMEKGKSYFWAHVNVEDFNAVAIPIPKGEELPEVAPMVAFPVKGTASA